MNAFAYGGALAGSVQCMEMVKIGQEGVAMGDVVGTLPWLRPLVWVLPQTKLLRLREVSMAAAQARRAAGSTARDLMSYLVRTRPAVFRRRPAVAE
jgi:hypothetical protein